MMDIYMGHDREEALKDGVHLHGWLVSLDGSMDMQCLGRSR